MCSLRDVPSGWYLPLPWQGPIYWLGFALLLALAIGGASVGIYVQRKIRAKFGHMPGIRWIARLWLSISIMMGVTVATSGVLTCLIALPTIMRRDAWFDAESVRLQAHGCNLQALFATDTRLSAAETPLSQAGGTSVIAMLLLFMLLSASIVSMIIIIRSRRGTLAMA